MNTGGITKKISSDNFSAGSRAILIPREVDLILRHGMRRRRSIYSGRSGMSPKNEKEGPSARNDSSARNKSRYEPVNLGVSATA